MFGFHGFHFDQAYAVLAGGGAAEFQGTLDKPLREGFSTRILLGSGCNQGVEIAISYMADDASLQVHLFQELLGISDKFGYPR